MAPPTIKAVFFDFMGTCLDWHTGAVAALPASIPAAERSQLALEWRHSYFDANTARLAAGLGPEDIDTTLRTTLDALLARHPEWSGAFGNPDAEADDDRRRRECVAAWHAMPAWPDVPPAIERLKAAGYQVFVFANGTTRLQLDLCRSSGLRFDMLFSSELLGVLKPSLESYRKTLDLVRVSPQEAVMVAAHTTDVGGARLAGMRTIYIHRWTDDIYDDMDIIKGENDFFLEDMSNLAESIAKL